MGPLKCTVFVALLCFTNIYTHAQLQSGFGSGGFVAPAAEFFSPYLDHVTVPVEDDGFAGPIPLPMSFPFFGNNETGLYINTNGVLSFGGSFTDYSPEDLPFPSPPLVLPYWDDVDISRDNGGTIYYNVSSNPDLIERALGLLLELNPDLQTIDFSPNTIIIATWDRVLQIGGGSEVNTFQVVLVSDGEYTFATFLYDTIQWGSEAQVGFNAGFGERSFMVPSARTEQTLGIEHRSNVGIPGIYAYRVDDCDIYEVSESLFRDRIFCSNDIGSGAAEFFFPYFDHQSVPAEDDDYVGPISLSMPLPFFGNNETELYINTNGVLSFQSDFTEYSPEDLPFSSPPLVLPYWDDVDISRDNGGSIYYSVSSNPDLIERALSLLFTLNAPLLTVKFFPSIIIIATWDRVLEYSGDSEVNTFQVALVSDGQYTFAAFLYDTIQWGSEAQIGFNAGDGERFFMDPSARTEQVLSIEERSNTGIPGAYIYRVDDSEINDGGASGSDFGPPTVTPIPVTGVVLTSASNTATITCSAFGVPTPVITWRRAGSEIEDSRIIITSNPVSDNTVMSQLVIQAVVFGDRGEYTCRATNPLASDSDTATLITVVPPTLDIEGAPMVPLPEGDVLRLVCQSSESWPSPALSWRINNSPVLQSDQVVIRQEESVMTEEGLFITSSTLTVVNTVPSDSGTYSCRGDLSVPQIAQAIPPSVSEPVAISVQARNECIISTEPLRTPCVNGFCVDLIDEYRCICFDEFEGANCTDRVVQVVPPVIVETPRNETYSLGEEVSVACQVTGSQLQFEWYRDGEVLEEENFPFIVIPSVQPGNRGYYVCVATNDAGTAQSYPGLVLLEGVRVYAASIGTLERTKREIDLRQALAEMLIGTALPPNDQIIINSATVDSESSPFLLTLTLVSLAEGGAYPDGGVTGALTDEVASAAGELGFTLLAITRQDGCPVDEDEVYSWPESDLSDVAVVSCPCGDLDTLLTINRAATRVCGGSFSAGVAWMAPDTSACEFNEIAQALCGITMLDTVPRAEAIADMTTIVDAFQPLDVSIASEILLDIIGDTELLNQTRDNVLTSIDQLLEVDVSVIRQSQEESRATTKLLEGIQTLSDIVDLGSDNSETFIRNRFSLHIEEQLIDDFNGVVFNAFVSTEANTTILTTSVTKDEKLESNASLTLPPAIFEELSLQNVLFSARFTYAVYNDDALYQRPEENFKNFAVGSVIIAASLTEITVANLTTPVMINFTKNEEAIENGTNATCAFWDPEMFDGFGGYSTDGCRMVEETEKDALCECDHLTSFALLLDISPQLAPPSLALEVITYIGLIVSIISLVVTILTYLSSPKLRKSEVGLMLINVCFALLGLYIVFIISGQALPLSDGACGFFAAVLHYFMLAYFFWTAAEALFLYFKLVQVFSSVTFMRKLLIASIVVCWVSPVVIVAISLGGYQFYYNDVFCRPTAWPFWFGFVVPFVLIWTFNWIMFILIMVALCRHANQSSAKKSRKSVILRHLFIAMVLSLLFGLGWAFGLIGSAILPPAVHVPAQYIFSIFIGLQGVLIFILHAVRSSDAREEWKRWLYLITCRSEKYRVLKATAIYSRSTMKATTRTSESYHSDSGTLRRVIDSGESSNFEKVALDTIEENPSELAQSGEITGTIVENVYVTGPTSGPGESEVPGEETKEDLSLAADKPSDDITTKL